MSINFQKIFTVTLLAGLFLLPAIFWPPAQIPFEVPRAWAFNRWVEVLVVLSLLGVYFQRPKLTKLSRFGVFLLTFLYLSVILSAIFGSDFSKSFYGNPFRADGVITLVHLALLSVIVAFFTKNEIEKKILFVASASAFYISILTLVQKIAVSTKYDIAAGITFGNPNFLAGFLAVTLPASIYVFSRQTLPRKKLLVACLVACQVLALIFTKSIVPVSLGIVYLCLWAIHRYINKKSLRWLLAILMAFFLSSFIYQTSTRNAELGSNESRSTIYTSAIYSFGQRPINGWGWANFDFAYDNFSQSTQSPNAYIDKAHGHFLEHLSTTGALGATAYVTLAAWTVFRLQTDRGLKTRMYLLAMLALLLVHSQTNVISISEEIFFWIILGIALKKS